MKRQQGAALMIILMIAGVLAAFFAVRALNGANTERDKVTAAALAQAKEALIGFASTYRDTRPLQLFGFLPCPDTNNDGNAEGNCGLGNVSVVGRLPWRTLGLPPLRDSEGECLWYAVSGRAKDNPKTAVFNWDTTGQFIMVNADGVALSGPTGNDLPFAVVFAPRAAVGAQNRSPAGAVGCSGSVVATETDYLESSVSAVVGATTTFTVSTVASARAGTNNDQAAWIISKDVFDAAKKRTAFAEDINIMLDDLEECLGGMGSPYNVSATNKGIDNMVALVTGCPTGGFRGTVRDNWQDNLLYTKPGSVVTESGVKACNAVLLFGGDRGAGQIRDTVFTRSDAVASPANYLEASNATRFGSVGSVPSGPFDMTYGRGKFNAMQSTRDIVRCITSAPVNTSFGNNFAGFIAVGVGVTATATAATQTLAIADAPGVAGGCFWSPTRTPLAGRVIRAYYDYQFTFPDPFALTSVGADRGNGFSLQMVTGQFAAPPNTCGTEANMGVLGAADVWGADSIIFETDVRRDVARADPVENHSAILLDGFLDHAPASPGATITSACNGTATGCRHSPATKFEETPLQAHNQRIEIHSGCDSTCTLCNPSAHAVPNNYARVSAWVDCTDCNDTVTDINRVAKVPTMQRCVVINAVLNTVYFGFTGGFRSGASQQGVTLTNLFLRSE
jgi:type II secretory pathway pseudopilin PulG